MIADFSSLSLSPSLWKKSPLDWRPLCRPRRRRALEKGVLFVNFFLSLDPLPSLATLLELFLLRRRRQDGCPVNLATFLPLLALLGPADSFLITFAAATRTRARDSQFLISPSSLVSQGQRRRSACESLSLSLSVFHLLERSFADQEERVARNPTRRARD